MRLWKAFIPVLLLSALIASAATAAPPPATCGHCEGKLSQLTLRYTGSAPSIQVQVSENAGNDQSQVFSGTVHPGEPFSFSGKDRQGTFGTSVRIAIGGILNAEISTTCDDDPVGPGFTAGNFEVVSGASKNGGALCPIAGPRSAAALRATLSAGLLADADGSRDVSPGDTLRYTAIVTNPGTRGVANVAFLDAPDPATRLVPGSVTTTQGTVTTGNGPGDTVVTLDLGGMAAGRSATITFQVRVGTPPAGATALANQGFASGADVPGVPTDDPSTPQIGDPTRTALGTRPLLEALLTWSRAGEQAGAKDDDGGDGNLLYTATVRNRGLAPATGAIFTDTPAAPLHLAAGSVTTSQGTVTTGNGKGNASVAVNLGTLPPGGTATVTFRAAPDRSLPDGTRSVANQGKVISNELPAGLLTDDPQTFALGDPTVTPFGDNALLSAVKYATLLIDADGDGRVGPGDAVRYVVVVTNAGHGDVDHVLFGDTLDANTALVPGTVVTSAGTVVLGNVANDSQVLVSTGTLAGGQSTTLALTVGVRSPVSAGALSLSNQGTVTADGQAPLLRTDDPGTLAVGDPTVTPLAVTAAIGDFVWNDRNANGAQDSGEPGLGGVAIRLLDGAGNVLKTTTSAADGSYRFDKLPPGTYVVQFTAPVGYALSPKGQGTDPAKDSNADPASGRTAAIALNGVDDLTIDAGFTRQGGVGDFVWEDFNGNGVQDPGEPGLAGVKVRLLDESGGELKTTSSAANGSYRFEGLAAGKYIVEFTAPLGFFFSPRDRGGDDTKDSDAEETTGRSPIISFDGGTNDATVDAGLYRPAFLGDLVWHDLNGDGIRTPDEPGFSGVKVNLFDPAGRPVAATLTGDDGLYKFDRLVPGQYVIGFEAPPGTSFSPKGRGSDDMSDSDADPVSGRTAPLTLMSGDRRLDLDAGLFQPLTRIESSPASGESDVALTRETIIRFSSALAASAVIDESKLFAEFGGKRLPALIHMAPDRRAVTLFYQAPLPASARVRVTLVGDGLLNLFGNAIDADGDGLPGGTARIDFDTLSLTTVLGTRACGRVFASALAPGNSGQSVNVPLGGVTITVEGSGALKAATDSLGNFCLDPAPAGRFFVLIDGRTATNGVPPGTYYPTVGKAWETTPGQQTIIGDIYLPLIPVGTLQPVSQSADTTISFAPSVQAAYPELAGTRITVPADSLYAADGTRGGRVGIAPVPPDRLPAPLPPGLHFPLVITVQTNGPANFDKPVPVCFPNLPDPTTHQALPPGSKSALWSFNHDTGNFEIVGPMTVSKDGTLVCTDPGVGILAPSWHGTQPGCSGSGGPPGTPPPPPNCDMINKALQNDYNGKQGSAAATLSHQILCLAQTTCNDNDKSFIKKVLEDEANHRINPPGPNPIGATCRKVPGWIPLFQGQLPFSVTAYDVCAAMEGFGYHFPNELWPSFVAHCPLDSAAHDQFFKDGVVPCFDKVYNSGELSFIPKEIAQTIVPVAATLLRGVVNAICPNAKLASFLAGFPSLPPPLTRDQLFAPGYESLVKLKVEAVSGAFFLPVGTSVQLKVTRTNADGSVTDLTAAASGTLYYATVDDGSVTVTTDGLVSILGTSAAIVNVTPPLYVVVRNGNDMGIGQFAVTDVDTDGDLIVDSVERKLGLDPQVPNGLDSDLDGDGVPDIREVMMGTDPLRMDTDGDGIDDGTEIKSGLDPLTPSLNLLTPSAGLFDYMITDMSTGVVQRGRSSASGFLNNVVLAPNSRFRMSVYQPSTGKVAEGVFSTPASGAKIALPPAVLKASSAPDSDGDGLPDDVEAILGTNPTKVDTDGDGIPDGAEVAQGTDPLDGIAVRTGVTAAVNTSGPAVDICAVNNVAAIAQSQAGLAVFNVFNGMNPTIVAQVDTPGTAQAVACAGNLAAVADGTSGLAVVDVTDPPAAKIVQQVDLGGTAQAVTVAANVAYVGLGSGKVVAVDMQSGSILESVQVGGSVQDLAIGGETLYVLTQGTLSAIPLYSGPLQVAGSVPEPGRVGAGGKRLRLFVGGGRAYVTHTQGYDTFDLTLPTQPVVIANGVTTQFGWRQIVLNGSGLGIAAVGNNSTTDGDHSLSLYNTSDPAKTNVFLTTFDPPTNATAVSIYNGIAYVADGAGGLKVVTYLPYDNKGVAPTITLSTNFAAGVAEEGKVMRLTADVKDDVQVRNVEFFVDGVKVLTDGNFPFEHRFVSPLLSQQASFSLQACATDTGGNRTCTATQTVNLTKDATPPRVVSVTPANSASLGQGTLSALSATFSEPVDPATVSGASFTLTAAGPDGILGTADDVPASGGGVTYRDDIRTAFLTFNGPLPVELYRATITSAVTDRAGNPLTAAFAWTFRVRGPLSWINPAGGRFSDPANWSDGVVPGPSDIAFITLTGNYTVVVDRNVSVGTLTLGTPAGGPTLWVTGNNAVGSVFVNVAGDLNSSGTLRLESQGQGFASQLAVAGLFTNTGTINVEPGSGGPRALSGNLNNLGQLNVDTSLSLSGGTYDNEGLVRIAVGQLLAISGQTLPFNQNNGTVSGAGVFWLNSAVLNFNGGTFDTVTPVVANGTLKIGPVSTGAAGFVLVGASTLSGNVAPSQSIWVRGDNSVGSTTVTAAAGFTNAGTLRLESQDQGFSVNLTVTNGLLTSTGTITSNVGSGGSRTLSANLVNTGTLTVNQTLTLSQQNGVYSNQGQVAIAAGQQLLMSGQGQVFNQNGGAVVATGSFEISSATFNFNNGTLGGNPVILRNATLNVGPGSAGAAGFVLAGSSNLSGDVAAAQSVWLRGDNSVGSTTVTAAAGFTNAGLLRLESQDQGFGVALTVTNGILTNTGTIAVNPGTGGSRTLSASLDNRGTMSVAQPLTLATNNGIYNNLGQLTIAANQTLSMSGQGQTFNQNAGNLAVSGTFAISSASLNFNGGTITGNSPAVRNGSLAIGSGSTGAASFVLLGSSNLSGDIAAAQSVWVRGDNSVGSTTVTSATGFNNAGHIRIESQDQAFQSSLTLTGGTLTNLGTIDVNPGSGGSRILTANLVNLGSVNVNADFTLSKSGATHGNGGTIAIASGRTFTVSGSGSFDNAAAGTINGAGTLSLSNIAFSSEGTLTPGGGVQVSGGSLSVNGGTTSGIALVFRNAALNLGSAGTDAATFILSGTSSLSGNVAAGQTLWLRGDNSVGSTSVTASAGFTNAGTLRLESQDQGFSVNLTVTGGALVNTGTINVNPGTGGSRTISADLTNSGSLNVNLTLALAKANGVYSNQGQVTIAANQRLVMVDENQVFNQNAGSLTSSGSLEISSAVFNFNGGTVAGNPLILRSAALNIAAGSTGAASFVLTGTSTFSGDIAAAQSVWLRADNSLGGSSVTAANGFTNNGLLRLESQDQGFPVTLTVTNGTLTNAGTIAVNPGSGGSRTLAANLLNQGVLNVNQTLTLARTNGTHANQGQVGIAANQKLLMIGENQVWNQNAGSLTVSGSLEISSAIFNLNGGTIAGNAPILRNATLGFGVGGTAPASFVLSGGSTISGDISAGQSVWLRGDNSVGSTTVTAATSFTNAGDLRLESQDQGFSVTLRVTSGTLTNTGTLDVNPGSGGSRSLTGNLNNQGVVNVQLGGTSAGSSYGQLNVSGLATLAGTLNVTLINGFAPSLGQTFQVLGYGSHGGTFTTLTGADLGGGLRLNPSYSPTVLTLTVVTP